MPRSQNVESTVARLSRRGLDENGRLCDGFFPQLRGGTVMLREMFGLALLSVVVASTALAKPPVDDPPPPSHIYRFAGFSMGTETGDAGIPGMHATCQVNFGESARMCTVEEYLLSPNAEQPDQNAWVQVIDRYLFNSGDTCTGWSSQGASDHGLTINHLSPGRIVWPVSTCDTLRPITCCTPLQ